jgi:hypothetical protein
MKKLGFLVVLVVLLSLTFAVTGCKDDVSLEGTWEAKAKDQPGYDQLKELYDAMGIKGDTVLSTLEFNGGVVVAKEYSKDGKTVTNTATGSYVEDGDNVTMTFGSETLKAVHDGSTLTVTESDGDKTIYKK